MKKKIGLLLIVLLTIISIPVHAKTQEQFYTGDDVTIEKSIGATTFVAGNLVEVNSEIDGISFVAGNIINMKSTQDYAFVAGNNINLEKFSAKDAFIAGNVITMKDVTVRDLYASGSTVKVDGVISHNAFLGGDTVIINSKINGDVYVAAENIKIGENAVINGTLKYPEEIKPVIDKNATIAKTKTYKGESVEIEVSPVDTYIIPGIISYLSILVIALLLMALNKKLYEKIAKYGKKNEELAKSMGIGILALVATPIAILFSFITVIGIPLGIILMVGYMVLFYLTIIPTSYCLGHKFLKDKISNPYLLLTVSLLIVFVLKSIPLIGGLVSLLSLFTGFGIFTALIKETIKAK